jgi:hypothetical protein
MLDRLLTGPSNIKELCNNYLNSRTSSELGWKSLHTIFSHLNVRFPLRPEVTITGTGDEKTVTVNNIPKAEGAHLFSTRFYDGPPAALQMDNGHHYCHNHAVTASEHTPASENVARNNPVMKLGLWSNAAEISIFSGLARLKVTSGEDLRESNERIQGSNQDGKLRIAFPAQLRSGQTREGLGNISHHLKNQENMETL